MPRWTCCAPVLAGTILFALGAGERLAMAQASHELSVAQAVRAALASDAELYIAREDARDAVDGIALARAAFLPRLTGEIYVNRDARPPTVTEFQAVDSIAGANVGIAGRLDSGLTYDVSAGLVHQDRDDPTTVVYNAATTTTVQADLVQPLRRGSFAAARAPIVVASLRERRTEQELRARIEQTVGAVEVAYWNLVRARSERDARQSALALAKEQQKESEELRRLGTGADLDVVEARAGVSRREQELLQSEQDVVDADGRLFAAIGVRDGDPGWVAGVPIEPTDAADLVANLPDVEAALALSRSRRADVLAARARIDEEVAGLAVTDDQRRAAVDLIATVGATGFAGSLATNYATAGVNGTGLMPPYFSDTAYDGGLGTSLKNTAGRDINVLLGLRFELPLGHHEAEIRHAVQQRSVSRARLEERQTLARVESEVRTTVARLAVNARLVEAADRTVELSDQLLQGTRKRFRVGAGTTFDVLRVSEELTRARVEAARARADYRISLTRLASATGTLLDELGISVTSLGATPK